VTRKPADTVVTNQGGMIIVSNSGYAEYYPPAGFIGSDSYSYQEEFESDCCDNFMTAGVNIVIDVVDDGIVAVKPNSIHKISVGPNPFSDQIFIDIDGFEIESEIRLFDAKGKLVKFQRGDSNIKNLNDLDAGIYILTINNGKMSESFKLLKQ